MITAAYIVLGFTALQLIVAIINLVTQTHLPHSGRQAEKKVSVLIPARNEENNIANLLNDLKDQPCENMEVIVCDDQSDDRTAEIAGKYSAGDPRFRVISPGTLPGGWLGKNHACHTLSKAATGEYLLFLDADVRISGNVIGDAVAYSKSTESDLISIFPMQKIITPGEWATVPNMNYILVSLLPLVLVRRTRFISLAAANGQFMFFRKSAYGDLLPHEKMKNSKVEDILISRYFKKEGKNVSCLLGDERIACRMYTRFSEAVNGFSKNVAEFFGGSHFLAFLFWIITTIGFLPLLFMPPAYLAGWAAMYLATRVAISFSGRQSIIKNLLWLLPLQVSMGMFIVKSLTIKITGRYSWKGREIS